MVCRDPKYKRLERWKRPSPAAPRRLLETHRPEAFGSARGARSEGHHGVFVQNLCNVLVYDVYMMWSSISPCGPLGPRVSLGPEASK